MAYKDAAGAATKLDDPERKNVTGNGLPAIFLDELA